MWCTNEYHANCFIKQILVLGEDFFDDQSAHRWNMNQLIKSTYVF